MFIGLRLNVFEIETSDSEETETNLFSVLLSLECFETIYTCLSKIV